MGTLTATATVAAVESRAERRQTRDGGRAIAWRLWGAGPPLVLLHGASGSWTHFIRNVDALASRFRVIVPDMPGFGDSDPPDGATADVLAAALERGLDEVVPPPARLDLAGFSFGGIIAGLLAARLGDRVGTLALLGPNGMALPVRTPRLAGIPPGATEREIREVHRENLRRLMLADPAAADDLAVALQMENVRRARFRSGDIPASDALLRALPRIRARIAGIWGERDAFAAPDLDARRATLARFAPDLDFRVVPGAGHWACYEAADSVNAALLDALKDGRPRC